MTDCARCGKPLQPPRKVYCSDGCADWVAHQKRLQRFAKGKLKLAKFREYDYRQPQSPWWYMP